jgi:hypothetical protein
VHGEYGTRGPILEYERYEKLHLLVVNFKLISTLKARSNKESCSGTSSDCAAWNE